MSETKEKPKTENLATKDVLKQDEQQEREILEAIAKEEAELKAIESAKLKELEKVDKQGQRVNEEGIVMIKILFPNAPTAGGGFREKEIPLDLWERVKTTQDNQGHPFYKDAKEA